MADDLTFIDLFAGCGGLARGFLDAGGYRAVGACEFDPDAAETYHLNVDEEIFVEPIEDVDDARWPRARVVIGGPPCQGFSQLGRRDPKDPRSKLWIHYARVLRACDADIFVMENVPQLLRSDQFAIFKETVEHPSYGFTVRTAVLNAADYGVPQSRRRAIVIGSRHGEPTFPLPTHGSGGADEWPDPTRRRTSLSIPQHVDVRHALAGLPRKPTGKDWHVGRAGIRPESITRYKAVPHSGGNRFQMQDELDRQGLGHLVPECWRNKPTGTTDVFGRMWWDRPAPTIRTEFFKPEKGRYLHPSANRPITVREAARLQSFPDDFIFPEHQRMTSVAKQIGNAVPPLLAKAVALAVKAHIDVTGGEPRAVAGRRAARSRVPAYA